MMRQASGGSHLGGTFVTQMVALAMVIATFLLAHPESVSKSERRNLAKRFHFTRLDVPVEKLATGELRTQHPVHPSLERIRAWISVTGASVTIADLDGDGLPNDMCLTDPRLGRLIVMPVPGTPPRYEPFSLDPGALRYDPITMLPTAAVVGDFNEDGLADILVGFWGRSPILYLRKASAASNAGPIKLGPSQYQARELIATPGGQDPAQWYTNAATQADIDGDGHLDLVMGNFFSENADVLNPNGTGVAKVMHAGKSKAMNGGGPKLFLWRSASSGAEPTAQFTDESESILSLTGHGWVFAVGAADLDNDTLPEIYYANDYGPDRLLYNRSTPGHPEFTLTEGVRSFTTPKSYQLGHDSFKGMGVGFGDVNHDGLLDIYVSNIADEWALHEGHFLWLSNGHPESFKQGIAPYSNGSEELGVVRSGWGWDSKLADFDNDGDVEAIQATGFIKGTVNRWPELQALGTSNDRIISDPRFWPKFTAPTADVSGHNVNPFFVRSASGRFVNVATELGMTEPLNSRGIATADVDGDGRLDFAVADQWGPSYFYHNDSPSAGAFIGLHVLLPVDSSTTSEFRMRPGHPGRDTVGRPAIGTVARIKLAGGRVLIEQSDGGSGHAGRSSPDIQFGLGKAETDKPIDVELTWLTCPDGQHTKVEHHTIEVMPGTPGKPDSAGWYTVVLGTTPAHETVKTATEAPERIKNN